MNVNIWKYCKGHGVVVVVIVW